MAANSGLSWVNHIDGSATVLSASQTAGDLSISNVADPVVGKRWRTTTLTAYGQADFGANKTIGIVCLRFPRDTAFPTAGTVTHRFDADGGTAGAGATLNSGALAIGTTEGYGYHVYKLSTAISARYWRWTFNVTGVSFVDVGRAWAGEWFVPTYDIAFGYGDEWGDLSGISASRRSGAEFIDAGPRQRLFAFGLNALSESERNSIREMQRIAGVSQQILFCKDTTAPTKETVLGRLGNSTPILHPNLPIFTKAFTVRESL